MTYSPGHVPQWTLELLAEDALPPEERVEALAHVDRCVLCAAELEACRALVVALSGLPRFEPSAQFADAVMSKVRVRPAESWAFARMRRLLPSTRRGWMMLAGAFLAPLAPLVAGMAWLLSQPMVTAGGLWSMSDKWISQAFWSLLSLSVEAVVRSRVWEWGQDLAGGRVDLTSGGLPVIAVLMIVATPLAAWSLARLLRTPMGDMTHAN